MVGALAVLVLATGATACAGAPRAERAPLTQAEWTRAREHLAWMRSTESVTPYVVELRVAMREPWTGRLFEARGALAVQPHSAARMILVGPGGGTALDMWISREKWRFVVPAADFKRAGGTDPAEARGLPVGFFRWWFLSPLEGRLLTADASASGRTYVLRDGGGTVTVHEEPARRRQAMHVTALRREGKDVEGLEWTGRAIAPHPGDRARYVQDATGLEVDVLVEAVGSEEPDPAAFLDPDNPGVPL